MVKNWTKTGGALYGICRCIASRGHCYLSYCRPTAIRRQCRRRRQINDFVAWSTNRSQNSVHGMTCIRLRVLSLSQKQTPAYSRNSATHVQHRPSTDAWQTGATLVFISSSSSLQSTAYLRTAPSFILRSRFFTPTPTYTVWRQREKVWTTCPRSLQSSARPEVEHAPSLWYLFRRRTRSAYVWLGVT